MPSKKDLIQFLVRYEDYLHMADFSVGDVLGHVSESDEIKLKENESVLSSYVEELKTILSNNITCFSSEERKIIRDIINRNNNYRKDLQEGEPNDEDRWFELERHGNFGNRYDILVNYEASWFKKYTLSKTESLINLISQKEDENIHGLVYPFPEGKLEDDITNIINSTYQEVLKDYKNECYISAISLCGKIIETVLNSLFVKIFDKNPDEEKLGFNAMLNRLKKKEGYEFGELEKQMSLISAHRNKAIHGSITIPTQDEARGIISLTKDILLKVASK